MIPRPRNICFRSTRICKTLYIVPVRLPCTILQRGINFQAGGIWLTRRLEDLTYLRCYFGGIPTSQSHTAIIMSKPSRLFCPSKMVHSCPSWGWWVFFRSRFMHGFSLYPPFIIGTNFSLASRSRILKCCYLDLEYQDHHQTPIFKPSFEQVTWSLWNNVFYRFTDDKRTLAVLGHKACNFLRHQSAIRTSTFCFVSAVLLIKRL